ncbi:molybdopterin-dependent oxidoreductase [Acuticoccus sp. I52.16.1]|uniref:molybdopterin-dependent oxidoreductase n=1 Tax=Acuticoccus sp. I52.16.1 TaxID=2928472 RepID=UPI001FD217BD|nr:molybdopterin-dependent oxidoreductase [Acuticoccus sp. I52.16.1]UOM34618.1 molybdopterin-dependent oxidoreductase [Acuticoccus sp. I52.16.1]
MTDTLTHSSHWGAFTATPEADGRLEIRPHPGDPDPSPILQNFTDTLRHPARVARPMVRRGWLTDGPGPTTRRGTDEFVAVPWDEVLDRLAAEMTRVGREFGPEAVFGGSYGWSSAGRFHHAQSQVHRFLNMTMGGYVRSVGTYSSAAAYAIIPHVIGKLTDVSRQNVTWDQVARHTELVLAFGGMALKNSTIAQGGISAHVERGSMAAARARGARFVNISPLRSDMPEEAGAQWLPIQPGTDTALMLAMMFVLDAEGLADTDFVERYTVGFEKFAPYLRGTTDGRPKDPTWAAAITGIPAETIADLARLAAKSRTLVATAHALQRSEHGEQPLWAAVVLAAMLGDIGLPGGGYHYSLGAMGHTGRVPAAVPLPTLPQGKNGVTTYIPVARITDMLEKPGETYDYNGNRLTYPDIKLMFWAGGNPFHHHQDLARLAEALGKLDTFVVNDYAFTAAARHADIVLPATMSLEREDLGAGGTDPRIIAMRKVAEPYGEARDDYEIFAGVAERMGRGEAFTEGRDAEQWLEHLYQVTRDKLIEKGAPAPTLSELRAAGELEIPMMPDDGALLARFRADPEEAPLATATGKIEIHCDTIAAMGYDDCPGHPTWLERAEVPRAGVPLWLIANQPASRLHSQLDYGATSIASKRNGREEARLHPDDAAARGIGEGDVIAVSSARGQCLATARITEDVLPGCVNLSTGAWYDPVEIGGSVVCVHGNPNAVTLDRGTSKLGQGCTGQLCAVEVARWTGQVPPVRVHRAPDPA